MDTKPPHSVSEFARQEDIPSDHVPVSKAEAKALDGMDPNGRVKWLIEHRGMNRKERRAHIKRSR